jgi:peptidoglycan LD-endopeptidase CwlK
MAKFSKRSLDNLNTCDERLVELFSAVVKKMDCTILEGHRSPERQAQLFSEGKTKTLSSKHNKVPSMAVDVMPYPIHWDDLIKQRKFALLVYQTAMDMGTRVKWGGSFTTFYDGPHWELIE